MLTHAHDKATELYHFACSQGAPLSEFQLVLTEAEAWELLEWQASDPTSGYAGNELLMEDIRQAKLKGDPYPVLENFSLCGLDIRPVRVLH